MKRTLVLVGGGHAHIEVLRQFALDPPPDVDVALFDPSPSVWYPSMLPGVIAGHYEPSDAKVNLWALCQRARVRFFQTSVLSINAETQRIETGLGERHRFDMLSIDVGSVARELPTAPGAYVVAAKPIDPMLAAITEFESVRTGALTVRVIGGGATAVEVALALAYRWRDAKNRRVSIVSATSVLKGLPSRARRTARHACKRFNVTLRENSPVHHIDPTRLRLHSGEQIETQLTILATGYAPAPLLNKTVITGIPAASVSVNKHLQCNTHPNIFAAGDCAAIDGVSVPKAGVFAVRQGPVLAHNLLAVARGEPLQSYAHQAQALRLISLGEKRAIAVRNGLALGGEWAWRWKDSIDRKWMLKYAPGE